LPTVGGDANTWGAVLNDYLSASATATALATSPVATATTFDVAVVTPNLKVGSLIAIDAYTTNCELRRVTGITGNTVSVAALGLAHNAGSYVLINTHEVEPRMFGCVGDGSTDDWAGFQRMLYQVNRMLTSYGPVINGGGLAYRVTKPLTFSQHTMHNLQVSALTSFAPADANNALMMSCSQAHYQVTATASDNSVTRTGGVFPNVGDTVVFNNMYGETLPAGLVNGRVYYVKTKSGDQMTITVSETSGGAEVDLTTDGSGWAAGQIGALTKHWWKDIIIHVAIADLNGLVFGAQQPADIYRLRVNMTAACSRPTYGAALQTSQIARLYNPEFVVNGASNVVALAIGVPVVYPAGSTSVTGVHIQDANFVGTAEAGQTHVVIGGGSVCDDVVFSGETWLEGPGDAGVRLDGGRGIDLGNLYMSGSPPNGTLYEASSSGWRVGRIFNSGSNHIIFTSEDGVLFKSSGSSDNVAADQSNVMHGMRRVSSGTYPALQMDGRMYASTTSTSTIDWIVETLDVDATSGGKTITLPSAVGVRTFRFTVRKRDLSGNAVTVATTSSQTINGSTTYSLASQYKYVTVESDGANWIVVANN
jgi:hypothetical protein